MAVYDDEKEKGGVGNSPSDDDLRNITGINPEQEAAHDNQAHRGAAEDIAERENLFNPHDREDRASQAAVPAAGLSAAESGTPSIGGDTLGAGFNANEPAPKRERYAKWLGKNRKKLLLGGGATGGIVGLLVLIFFMLVPLKIETMVTNLQNRFFATSENATEEETQSLMTHYVEKYVLPGYSRCGTTVSKSCSANRALGTSPVSKLYNDWRNTRLENKLATKYGIEFKYDSASKAWYLKAPGTTELGDNIGPHGENLGSEFQRADRATMRSAARNAMRDETGWKKVMYRYQVGRLLEEKYGIKRCLVFCGTKDALADNVSAQKKAAQMFIAERVIQPRNQMLAVAMKCLLDENCHPESTSSEPCTEGDCELHGSPESDVEREGRTTLERMAAEYGIEDTAKLTSLYNDMSERGFGKYLIDNMLKLVFDDATSKSIADKIPVVGWINLAAQLVNGANEAGPKLKKLAYITNAAAAVSLYMTYRSYADEIHTGHVTATEVGSFTSSLGPGNQGDPNDEELGGTASAEQTPLYSYLMNGDQGSTSSSSISLLDIFSPPKAFAADGSTVSSNASSYICNDGNPVSTGQLVCNEEKLGQGNGIANSVHTFLNLPGIGAITDIAKVWRASIGQIFRFVNGTISFVAGPVVAGLDASCDTIGSIPVVGNVLNTVNTIPGYCTARSLAKKLAPQIMQGITQWLIPNPWGSNMSGGRKFDMMAAGADVSGNDYAHTSLGGQKLTSTQTAVLVNEQMTETQEQFSHESFFARMFSTNTPYSFVSRLAMNIPTTGVADTAQSTFANLLASPFGKLTQGFSSFLSSPKAFAAMSPQDDPFNVVQYGYPDGTIPSDPEAYWDQNCSDNPSTAYMKDNNWNQAASKTLDPNSGMPVNTTANPCLLIRTTIGSVGGIYDTGLLTPDDLADVPGSE